MNNENKFPYAVLNPTVLYTTYAMYGVLPWSFVNVPAEELLRRIEPEREPTEYGGNKSGN